MKKETDELSKNLKTHVSQLISPIAKPKHLIFTPDLPKTRSGKIMRRILKQIMNNTPIGDTTTLASPDIIRIIQKSRIVMNKNDLYTTSTCSKTKIKLFSGSSHKNLAKNIANILSIELGDIKHSKFQCNENYVKIDETIRGMDTYILQTASSSVNDDLIELFLIMDTLKRASAASINIIMPHFAYARQDKKSSPREPISARLIADLMQVAILIDL